MVFVLNLIFTIFYSVGRPEPKSSTSSPIVRSFVSQPRRNLNASLNLNSSKKKTEDNVDLEFTSSNLARDKYFSSSSSFSRSSSAEEYFSNHKVEKAPSELHVKRTNSGTFVSHSVAAPTPARADFSHMVRFFFEHKV